MTPPAWRLAALVAAAVPLLAAAQTQARIAGSVRDPSGAPLSGAEITLLSPRGAVAATARSDAEGRFEASDVTPGRYVLVAAYPGLATRRMAVQVDAAGGTALEVRLQEGAFHEAVTVTASPGSAEGVDAVPQRVNVVDAGELALRAKAVLAQAAGEEEGLHTQRTSATMGGFFVRGLTGTKVNVYLDGLRYTTSAQRGGVSTFFDMVSPDALEEVEVVRGPSSAEYGSDALGGTVQLLTATPTFSAEGRRVSGAWNASFGSADSGAASSLSARYAAPGLGLAASLNGRRASRLRPGGGVDSHNAVTRFFGLPSSVALEDDRLPDTAFTQYGGQLRGGFRLTPTAQLSFGYLRGQQDGGRRYDQLLGGDGNLVADLRNLMLDHLHARFEQAEAGPLGRLSVAWSWTAQREERVNQGGNGNPRASLNHEPERTQAHGIQASLQRAAGRHELGLGADVFFESIAAPSFSESPTTGATAPRRGRVPDGARYRHGGVFVQDAFEAVPGRLRLNGALRFSLADYAARAADSPLVGGEPLWPDDDYDTSDVTFRAGALWTAGAGVSVAANVSRGFRAPDVTDLGTFGLTGSGYEVSNREVEGLDATVGTTADASAVTTGDAVRVLEAETSLSYELTLRYRSRRFRASLTAFQNDIDANVAKQSLILPQGAVGVPLAGEPITRQLPSGVVFVGVSPNPVLVRANFDAARIRGIEGSFDAELCGWLSAGAVFTALHSEDRHTGLPPNIEGGTPAPDAWLRVRFAPSGGRRFWVEPYLHAAAEQDRLSSLDLGDRRIGAGRSRSSIAAFFTNGARARGLVGAGPDGVAGTPDDVLLATGETLAQIQARVLGAGGASNSLFTSLPSYAVVGVRGAVKFGARHELLFDLENLADENYRGISWGVDAPGRGVYLRYALRF